MSLSGTQMLHALDEALRDVRREEDELCRRLARSVELTFKLRQTEGEVMRRLATTLLEPEDRAALTGSLTQGEVEARSILEQHGPELEAAQEALEALDRRIAACDAERAGQRAAMDQALDELRRIVRQLDAAAGADDPRRMARERAAQARATAREALAKARQAEADREFNGRAFRDDRLFSYLWARGYGTEAYAGHGLIARLDARVARLIGYAAARQTFESINALPGRLHENAERQQSMCDAADSALAELERAEIDAAGGRTDRLALEAATTRIAEIDAEIVVLEDERDDAARHRRELAQGTEPPLSSALEVLAEALGRDDVRALLRRARATEGEGAVGQIDELRQRASEEESDARDLRGRLRTLATRRRELEDIRYEFKRQGLDDAAATFDEERLATDMLNDFLRGTIGAADYWTRLRRSRRASESGEGDGGGFDWLGAMPKATAAPVSAAPALPGDEIAETGFSRPRTAPRRTPAVAAAGVGA